MVSLHWCTWALSSCSSSWCHCSGFSCCTVQALGSWASAVAARRLSWLYCMWDLPRPGKPPIHKFLTHSSAYGLRMDSFWGSQYIIIIAFSSVQSLSRVQLLAIPWIAARQASLSIMDSWSWLKLLPIKSVMPSSHLILYRPLLLLPPIPPRIRVFSNESTLHMRWPNYWSFSFSISPSNEHPGLISFRMDWVDLLAVQGTLKSFLQHHSSKASIFRCSAFFTVQLSHPYMTTGKTIALSRRTFVGEVMFLLFNMLSRLVITFLPRSKRLLFSWLQSLL